MQAGCFVVFKCLFKLAVRIIRVISCWFRNVRFWVSFLFSMWRKKTAQCALCWSGFSGLSWALECTGTRNVMLAALFFAPANSVTITVFANQLINGFSEVGCLFLFNVRQPSQDSVCVCAHQGNHCQKVVHCEGLVISYQVCPCMRKAVKQVATVCVCWTASAG